MVKKGKGGRREEKGRERLEEGIRRKRKRERKRKDVEVGKNEGEEKEEKEVWRKER